MVSTVYDSSAITKYYVLSTSLVSVLCYRLRIFYTLVWVSWEIRNTIVGQCCQQKEISDAHNWGTESKKAILIVFL